VCSALLILAEVAQLGFPEFAAGQAFDDNPGGLAALLLYLAFTILRGVIFIITTVGFLMWLHRSSSNLPAFGYWKSQGYSPAWAVGSFFVPIANLFMPYKALKEIWQKSRPANSQSFSFSSSPPGFFPASGAEQAGLQRLARARDSCRHTFSQLNVLVDFIG